VPLVFIFVGDGDGEGDCDCPRGYPYGLGDVDGGLSGLVCARRRRRSGSRMSEGDVGDVSESVLSGWRVTSGLDAAVLVPAGAAGPSVPSDCERRSESYGRWDGDGLYTSGLEPSGRVCVRKLNPPKSADCTQEKKDD
jgi:hypothetical protein